MTSLRSEKRRLGSHSLCSAVQQTADSNSVAFCGNDVYRTSGLVRAIHAYYTRRCPHVKTDGTSKLTTGAGRKGSGAFYGQANVGQGL
jgi:hypothetical protein